LKCQEQDTPITPDVQIKEEPIDAERWSWDDPWLPKIQTHTGCTYNEIIEKLQEEFFGSEPSSTAIQAKDAGPAHSTGDTSVSLPPNIFGQTIQTDASTRYIANWDYTTDQMHVDSHAFGMTLSTISIPGHPGSRTQSMPSLPAGPSLSTDVSQPSPSIDPRLLNDNVFYRLNWF